MEEKLQRIEELSRQAMIHSKNADRRSQATDERVSDGFHELELALTRLTLTVEQLVRSNAEQTGRSGLSEREQWLLKLFGLTITALIILAFGKAGIEAMANLKGLAP